MRRPSHPVKFPDVRAKFPVRARKIPCSVAQGIWRHKVEIPQKSEAKIVASGLLF
jgi:hypothetical protein